MGKVPEQHQRQAKFDKKYLTKNFVMAGLATLLEGAGLAFDISKVLKKPKKSIIIVLMV